MNISEVTGGADAAKRYAALKGRLKARLESVDEFSNNFEAAVLKAFELVPTLYCIKWTQYAPYFNDGDPCEFNIHDIWFVMEEDKEAFEEEGTWFEGLYSSKAVQSGYSQEQADAMIAVETMIHSAEDCAKLIFGEHAYVQIFRDGTVSIDCVDHD